MDFLIFLILFIIILPTIYAAFIGAPPVFTDNSLIQDIIKTSQLKEGDVFYELGTGTGRMITAVSKRKNIKAVGFELSPPLYFITLLKLNFKRRKNYKNYKIYFKNFLNVDLGEANVVFCFLMPKTMQKLENKFLKELKPGAKVVSYAFEIKNWKPYSILKKKNKPSVYFYKI